MDKMTKVAQVVGEIPVGVLHRRTDLAAFRARQRECYQRLLDQRMILELADPAAPSGLRVLEVLARCEAELAQLHRDAVLSNIVVQSKSSKEIAAELRAAKRRLLEEKLMPRFTPAPVAGDCELPGSVTATSLHKNKAFVVARDRIVEGLVAYSEQFVAMGLLGRRIHDAAASAGEGAYSFVLRLIQEEWRWTYNYGTTKELDYDPTAPFGQRRTLEHTSKRRRVVRHTTVERVHHLEKMTLSAFASYDKKLPPWAQELKASIPEPLNQQLHLVEGTIVREDMAVLDDFSQSWEYLERRVIKASPAIVLGDLVLAGWSNDDVSDDFAWWAAIGGATLLGLAGLALLVPGAGAAMARGGLLAAKWLGRAATMG